MGALVVMGWIWFVLLVMVAGLGVAAYVGLTLRELGW
jgi:hypothetical protein